MNEQQFDHYKKTVPDFERDHCFWVDPSAVEYDPHMSQTRALGHILENISRYAEIYQDSASRNVSAPFPPASVRKLPNNNFELKDGCTRHSGANESGQPLYVSNYQDKVLNWGPDDWDDFQGQANDHLRGTPNSELDMDVKIQKQIKTGRIERLLGYKYGENSEGYIEGASQHFRHDIYPNSGKSLDWFRRRVKNALKPQTLKLYDNYTKTQAFDFVKLHTAFPGKKVGDICGGRVFYVFNQQSHRNPNIIGYSATKIMDDPNVEINLAYYLGSLVGKSEKAILNERKNIEDWFDKVNNSHLGINFKHLYFLPQIKSGPNQEDLNKIIKSR